jgi:hypothetical protein
VSATGAIGGEERLAHVVTRLDIALLLDEAGIDTRVFSPDELDHLSRVLIRRRPRPTPPAERPDA